MAPKKVKSGRKKSPEHDEDPVYAAKRARNNEVSSDMYLLFKNNCLHTLCDSPQ